MREIIKEEWRPVVGYEGFYEVSDQGHVRSLDRTTKTKKGQRRLKGQPLVGAVGSHGYLCLNLRLDGKTHHWLLHRLVARAFLGEPEGLHVDHKDRDRSNNQVDNLRYVLQAENNKNKEGITSQFHGIYFSRDRGKWRATYKRKNIGSYKTEHEAFMSRQAYLQKLATDVAQQGGGVSE